MVVINMTSVQVTVSTFIFCMKEDSFHEVKYFYHIMLSPESISLKSIIYHRKFRSFMGKISQTDEIVFYSSMSITSVYIILVLSSHVIFKNRL